MKTYQSINHSKEPWHYFFALFPNPGWVELWTPQSPRAETGTPGNGRSSGRNWIHTEFLGMGEQLAGRLGFLQLPAVRTQNITRRSGLVLELLQPRFLPCDNRYANDDHC